MLGETFAKVRANVSAGEKQMSKIEHLISDLGFPCVGAKTALSKNQITVVEARDLRCPADDQMILSAVHAFVDRYERDNSLYASLIVSFGGPNPMTEDEFEGLMWAKLQALHELDSCDYAWDPAVSADPTAANFSLSLGGRAFYVIGLHPQSSRKARRFAMPAIVFNLHDQFERLRVTGDYETMQKLVRRRDRVFSGSVNPMLADFGTHSEARQYSGRSVEADWNCPFRKADA